MKKDFQRRTLLYVPGSSKKMLEKSIHLDADAIIYDLEDSVSIDEKDTARNNVSAHLEAIRVTTTNTEIVVRINAFPTKFALDDLVAVCQHCPDALIIPKATSEVISATGYIVTMLEDKFGIETNTIKLIPLLETAIGVEKVSNIIAASSRVVAAQFGAEDFTKEMGIARRADNLEIVYGRARLAVACKAHGIDCIDTPYTDYADLDGCKADTKYSKAIGMTGRTIIHPALLNLTKQIFTPTNEEIAEAREILTAYEHGLQEGKGAFSYKGKMIDAPIADRARQLLRKAQA